jgi:hypothetical protein
MKASSMAAVGSAAGVGGEKAPGMGSGGRLVSSTSDARGDTTPSECISVLSRVAELSFRSRADTGNDDNDSWLSRVALV